MANMGGYALANWPPTSRQKEESKRQEICTARVHGRLQRPALVV